MKSCTRCAARNPDDARFCMQCGLALPWGNTYDADEKPRTTIGGFSMFGLSVAASLLLSFVLMFVLKLPIFLLFGFLPLLWWRRKD